MCSRGGMAGCLAVPWWGYLHIQLRAAHDWVLVGGRAMFSLRSVACLPLGDGSGARWVWVKNASRVGQEWGKRGSRVGQYWASWIMRATSGGSRAGQELAPSGSIVGHAWPQSAPSIGRCCAIDVPKGGSGVGQWLVKTGSQASGERGTPGPPGHPRSAHP